MKALTVGQSRWADQVDGVALGVLTAVSSFTSLRVPGAPGIAEIGLALWLVVRGPRFLLRPLQLPLLTLGLIAVWCLALVSFAWGRVDPTEPSLGTWSLVSLTGTVVLLIVLARGDIGPLLVVWLRTFVVVVVFAQFALFAAEQLGFRPDPPRFVGLSSNPNQAAYALGVALAGTVLLRWTFLMRIPLLMSCLMMIAGTGSDTVILAIVAAFGLWAGLRLIRQGLVGAMLAVALSGAGVMAFLLSGTTPGGVVTDLLARRRSNQLQLRSEIWEGCINSIFSSPVGGNGPTRTSNPLTTECHNAFLDIGRMSGLVGLLVFLVLLVAIGLSLLRRHRELELAVFVGLVVSFLGNSPHRFTFVWLLLLLLTARLPSRAAGGVGKGSGPLPGQEISVAMRMVGG